MHDLPFVFHGRAICIGDNIDTDAILPAVYLNLTDEKELASHCMEDIYPGFSLRVSQGDILIAGDNFGCGSSREHAPVAIRSCGICCVVAKSFSRLFYRNAVNIGLPAITADVLPLAAEEEEVSVDCLTGIIRLPGTGREVSGAPLPPFMLEILRNGGLYGYLAILLKAQGRL